EIVSEAVDDKIKQVLFLYLVVCLGRLHTASKQTLTLTRCDRLSLVLLALGTAELGGAIDIFPVVGYILVLWIIALLMWLYGR
uniref:hypothetical protein n=1 Tax=Saliphagus sp. LR7 TaxID=2282654 RepID=UPI001E51D665